MSLKKYDELTEAQQKLVWLMYSNRDTVQQYLYNFEGEKYIGRQFYISTSESKVTLDVPVEKIVKDEKKVEEVKGKTQPVKRVKRTTKKK